MDGRLKAEGKREVTAEALGTQPYTTAIEDDAGVSATFARERYCSQGRVPSQAKEVSECPPSKFMGDRHVTLLSCQHLTTNLMI